MLTTAFSSEQGQNVFLLCEGSHKEAEYTNVIVCIYFFCD